MKNTTVSADLLRRGDIAGLLSLRRASHGDLVMTAPVAEDGTITVPKPVAPVAATPPHAYTQADLDEAREKARQQEKEKLYPQLAEIEALRKAQEDAEKRIKAFDTDLTARQDAEKAAIKAAKDAEEEKRLAELSFAEKLTESETRTQSRFQEMQDLIASQAATLAKEREFAELSNYRSSVLQDNDTILPELRDLVQGESREQIDQAVSLLEEKSRSILSEMAQATQQQRVTAQGVGVTAPPTGPMDTNSGYQTFSPDQIAGMSMRDYAANRNALLGAASQSPSDRGLLG